MKKYRWLITISFLVAALVCYSIGFSVGFGGFLILGIIFELLFWVNILKPRKSLVNEKNNIDAD